MKKQLGLVGKGPCEGLEVNMPFSPPFPTTVPGNARAWQEHREGGSSGLQKVLEGARVEAVGG